MQPEVEGAKCRLKPRNRADRRRRRHHDVHADAHAARGCGARSGAAHPRGRVRSPQMPKPNKKQPKAKKHKNKCLQRRLGGWLRTRAAQSKMPA